MLDDPVDEALTQLRAGVDGLLSGDLGVLSGVQVAGLIAGVEEQRRRLEAVDQRLLAEAGERGLAGEYGRTSVADLLVELTRVAPGEARSRVARSVDFGPRRAVTGEPLEPIHPRLAAAMRAGEVSAAHAAVITDCLGRLPDVLAHETFAVAERFLVEAARHEQPVALRQTAALLLARLDPDGVAPREEDADRRREFTLTRQGDGSFAARGRLTGEAGLVWRTVLDATSAPAPAKDGEPDARTAGQRRHDALLDAGMRLLRSGTLPDCAGAPVTILVRTTVADLTDTGGLVHDAHDELLSAQRLLRLAGDAQISEVMLSPMGAVLDYGRTRRLASPAQRRALAARDGGCCYPGCTRPAAWSEVHHIRPWADGGGTGLDNMCLLCGFHHREFEKRGWQVEMADGVPQWTPPAWLDPTRKPRRNTAHHLADLDLAVPDLGGIDLGRVRACGIGTGHTSSGA